MFLEIQLHYDQLVVAQYTGTKKLPHIRMWENVTKCSLVACGVDDHRLERSSICDNLLVVLGALPDDVDAEIKKHKYWADDILNDENKQNGDYGFDEMVKGAKKTKTVKLL